MTSSIKNLDTPWQLYGRGRPLKDVFELRSHQQQHPHSGHLGRRHLGMQTSATQPDTCSDCLDLNIDPAQVLCMHGAYPRGHCVSIQRACNVLSEGTGVGAAQAAQPNGLIRDNKKQNNWLQYVGTRRTKMRHGQNNPKHSTHHVDGLSVEKRTNFHSCFIYIPPSLAAPQCLHAASRWAWMEL